MKRNQTVLAANKIQGRRTARILIAYIKTFLLKDPFSNKSSIATKLAPFGRKVPKMVFITQKEKALLVHEAMKNSLNLLMGGNASGDFKVRPSYKYYYSETFRVFRSLTFIL
ncbi:hypothetical protein AVEN_47612-1 [Araneus ventricosus]|uniref:Uncharacterized protein n=1 Tax=Araneus ventricosus TaxID=182803 RepID=A0A4Y2J699_ARAVE|nr:hypothetical protein AVEN_47612-1 [Araneus ventricosus]